MNGPRYWHPREERSLPTDVAVDERAIVAVPEGLLAGTNATGSDLRRAIDAPEVDVVRAPRPTAGDVLVGGSPEIGVRYGDGPPRAFEGLADRVLDSLAAVTVVGATTEFAGGAVERLLRRVDGGRKGSTDAGAVGSADLDPADALLYLDPDRAPAAARRVARFEPESPSYEPPVDPDAVVEWLPEAARRDLVAACRALAEGDPETVPGRTLAALRTVGDRVVARRADGESAFDPAISPEEWCFVHDALYVYARTYGEVERMLGTNRRAVGAARERGEEATARDLAVHAGMAALFGASTAIGVGYRAAVAGEAWVEGELD